jgi:hypothetical protein
MQGQHPLEQSLVENSLCKNSKKVWGRGRNNALCRGGIVGGPGPGLPLGF